MVKKTGKTAARISFHTEDMASAGLPTDFDGVIVKAVYAPFNYPNRDGVGTVADVLSAKLTIRPDEDSGLDEFTQYYSAGDIESFAPSLDGEEPVDLDADDRDDMEGPFVVKVGSRDKMNNNSNFAKFVEAALAVGLDDDVARSGDLSQLEGVYGHWDRVPQPTRKGIIVRTEDKNSDREKTILVLTEIKEAPKAAAKAAKGKAAPAVVKKGKKEAEPEPEGDDLDTRIETAIVEALGDAKGNTFAKGKLPGIMMKAFAGDPDKAKAIKRAGQTEFLDAATQFAFDPDDGTLTLVE